MSNKVLEHLAKNYDKVEKGVKAVMGGKVLDYEAAKRLQMRVDELKELL